MTLRILTIPCLADNYAYIVAQDDSTQALVVDPSEAGPILEELRGTGLEPKAIVTTHHHHDHVGGVGPLCEAHPDIAIYAQGGAHPRAGGAIHEVTHDAPFEAAGMRVRPFQVPGHTLDGIAYQVEDALFTGDTLFVAGCGRLFEGSPGQMHDSLCNVLGELGDQTRVYCGHEYTEANLRFAATVEPENLRLLEKLTWAQQQAAKGQPTVPSTLGDERATNPFLRCSEPGVASRFGGGSPVQVFAAVRKAKDQF